MRIVEGAKRVKRQNRKGLGFSCVLLGIFTLLSYSPLVAQECEQSDSSTDEVLFTGALLAPRATVMEQGKLDFLLLTFAGDLVGTYDLNGGLIRSPAITVYQVYTQLTFGMAKDWEFFVVLPYLSQSCRGRRSANIGDASAGIGWQALREDDHLPALRFFLVEIFPSGKFDDLSEQFLGVDALGRGTFASVIGFQCQKIFFKKSKHPFTLGVSPLYQLSTSGHIHGKSAFGGTSSTSGKIAPGAQWAVDFNGQLALTRQLCFTVDVVYTNAQRNTFSGNPGGITPEENQALLVALEGSSGYTWSIAPALGYSFNESATLQIGFWGSFTGVGLQAFRLGSISLLWEF